MALTRTDMHHEELATIMAAYQPLKERRLLYAFASRVMDIVLTVLALIVAVPLVITFAILVKLETPGPAFYRQVRVGQDGRLFTLYKLRSMVNDAEKNGAQWAIKDDPRVTRVGIIIRRSRIDELPQLISILKGDMSIVGPRPERPSFTVEFERQIPGFSRRLQAKPGLTGWAQINGGYEMTPRQKWEADMYYINNRSLLMDLTIIARTIRTVLTGEGAR